MLDGHFSSCATEAWQKEVRMKIEKVNERQIRCTLTKADLTERELKLSELAYGTEKAKNLFRDMIQQASWEFGFEAEDIPLMIEAIPLSGEAIVLIITKVEDPEELDTRFSKFAPSVQGDVATAGEKKNSGADDVLDIFKKLKDKILNEQANLDAPAENAGTALQVPAVEQASGQNVEISVPVEVIKLYSFDDMEGVIRLAHALDGFYMGDSSLYKDTVDGRYYLFVKQSEHSPEDFNKVCNIITEYAYPEDYSAYADAYFDEHGVPVIMGAALRQLSEL